MMCRVSTPKRSARESTASPRAIVADRSDRRDRESQFREADRGAGGSAGRGEPDLVEQHAALSLGNMRYVAAENIEDVRSERHDPGVMRAFSSRDGLLARDLAILPRDHRGIKLRDGLFGERRHRHAGRERLDIDRPRSSPAARQR